MREIKFRAWLKHGKEIVDVEGIYFMNKVVHYIYNDYKYNEQEIIGDFFENIELMEYTGLKDMKGKEIYEGDILFESSSEEYFKVVFENGSFRAEVNEYSLDLEDYAHICEVVGNIYENPELLGDKNDF